MVRFLVQKFSNGSHTVNPVSYVPCLSTLAGMCLSGVVCSTQGSGMLTGEYWAAELAGMAGLWCGVAVLDCW